MNGISMGHELSCFLDRAHARLLDQDFAAVTDLASQLLAVRRSTSASEWARTIREIVRIHRVVGLLLEDPMSYRSFSKPRGYAGDAGLIDLIYRHPDASPYIELFPPRGRKIYERTVGCPGPESVRERRRILSSELDRAARDYENCAAVSIACGHLREAETSESVRSGAFSRLLGLDQDQASLAVANKALTGFSFEPQNCTVKALVAGQPRWSREFDFVYAAGLYDYLSDRFARRLTARLFDLLRPGGRLLIANFLPAAPDAGYLEAVMDWWLIYRTPDQIGDFARECASAEIASLRFFDEPRKHIGFLEIVRA